MSAAGLPEPSTPDSAARRATGSPSAAALSSLRRCPSCGYSLGNTPPAICPICSFALHDRNVTGADHTPYALAFAEGKPGFFAMCEFIWYAGPARIRHLGLIRASAASRRFGWINLLLLSLALGLAASAWIGFAVVTQSEAVERANQSHADRKQDIFTPYGDGWLRLAQLPADVRAQRLPELPADLWWNYLQAGLASSIGFVWGVCMLCILQGLLKAILGGSLKSRYQGEERLSAALHYATAWWLILSLAGVIASLRAVSQIGELAAWPWYPKETGILWAAGALLSVGLGLWWYWLARLAYATPGDTRVRVLMANLLVVPLVIAGCGAMWLAGLYGLHTVLTDALRLTF